MSGLVGASAFRSGEFSAETGRTEFNDSTDPSSFLYGGAPGGLNIQDIGYPDDIIEFVYWNIFINTSLVGITNDNDGDGVLNPGETGQLTDRKSVV